MTLLIDQPFGETFVFARARAGAYRGPDGQPAEAAADAPRFDHTATARPRGLLVEGRPDFRIADELEVQAGDWAVPGGTVLHAYETPEGAIERRAWYDRADPIDVVNACLNVLGWHRQIAYVPGHLRNQNGVVRWRQQVWQLGGVVLAEPGVAVGATPTQPLLEG